MRYAAPSCSGKGSMSRRLLSSGLGTTMLCTSLVNAFGSSKPSSSASRTSMNQRSPRVRTQHQCSSVRNTRDGKVQHDLMQVENAAIAPSPCREVDRCSSAKFGYRSSRVVHEKFESLEVQTMFRSTVRLANANVATLFIFLKLQSADSIRHSDALIGPFLKRSAPVKSADEQDEFESTIANSIQVTLRTRFGLRFQIHSSQRRADRVVDVAAALPFRVIGAVCEILVQTAGIPKTGSTINRSKNRGTADQCRDSAPRDSCCFVKLCFSNCSVSNA
ncbi:hypothetical protein KCU90_g186, partial [Aureobasidium melanogenum]